MKNVRGMKKAQVLIAVSLASILISAPASAVPTVPGYVVETYAGSITKPENLSFDGNPSGFLYVGNGDSTAGVRIHRISLSDQSVNSYGGPLTDPDAVIYDGVGNISGTPGSVIVGGGTPLVSPPYISRIAPDESTNLLFELDAASNPSDMIFDSTGRLLFSDGGGGSKAVFHITGSNVPTKLFDTPTVPLNITIDANDIIFVSDSSGTIRKYEDDVLSEFVTGLGSGIIPITMGTSDSVWGVGLYAIANDSLLHFDASGNQTLLGTGFDSSYTDISFGPDNTLFVSDYSGNQILRITPEPATLGLLLIGGLALFIRRK